MKRLIDVSSDCFLPVDKLNKSWSTYFTELADQSTIPLLKEFYAAGAISDQTPLSKVPFVAMDFETTGLDANNDDIVSIGMVPFSLKRIYCRRSKHWIVKPRRELAENSVVIHGIKHSDILEAPDINTLFEELLSLMAGKVMVVHYQHIERNFLAHAFKSRLGEGIIFPLIDTMLLEKNIRLQQRSLCDRLLQRPLPSIRLGDCRRRYHLPHYQSHHALSDSLASAELFQAQVSYHFDADLPISALWC
ncbi:MAG: 3'-5' exonuclease [Oleiphilus sp.]